ncbi:beta-lactamase family protein [Streptomyces sp. SID14478]|uniref:serine hydrolase domain-containing protein n=1 Tax=Streptomyces sp. SID14478 TaxID=2706073 RepID=UPI0013E05BA2|nr:serine hydrolase domain-containing protein [Streptomyces sp. SID14478]NEB80901.1 beta-lactamase family protein [Streptomyces sp. SID14478]
MFRRSRAVLIASIAAMAMAVSPAVSATARTTTGDAAVQRVLDAAVSEGGAPGIQAEVLKGSARWFGTAGVADTTTRRTLRPGDRFRIGSTTKTFTATVLLQLVGEGRLALGDSVEKWLPGVVRGNGHDGNRITVRQLLNHTSGIFNYTNDPQFAANLVGPGFLEHRFDSVTPGQLVKTAMSHAPDFAPGTSWAYSNTNFILAGMIAEKVTGHPLATEVTRRIIVPLGLTHTYLPGRNTGILGPHGKAYSKLLVPDPAAPVYDVTELNPSWAGSAGDMISTTGDINRFYSALLSGRLLRPAEQKAMFTTVPTVNWIPNTEYGLGMIAQTLSCGTTVWGHGGTIHGSLSWAMGLRDGSKVASTDINGDWVDQGGISTDLMQAVFCPPTGAGADAGPARTAAPAPARPLQF